MLHNQNLCRWRSRDHSSLSGLRKQSGLNPGKNPHSLTQLEVSISPSGEDVGSFHIQGSLCWTGLLSLEHQYNHAVSLDWGPHTHTHTHSLAVLLSRLLSLPAGPTCQCVCVHMSSITTASVHIPLPSRGDICIMSNAALCQVTSTE